MRIVVIGATSGIAEQCCRRWVARADVDLTLVGRARTSLERIASDLRVRGSSAVIRVHPSDLVEPEDVAACVAAITAQGAVDVVLIAHGAMLPQATCEADPVAASDALRLNGISPVLFADAFVASMVRAGHGTVGIIGSVAGDRGRKSNYVYGAAKGLVTRYAQGLQHRLAATAVRVVLIKPGPTDTRMTASLKAQGMKLASAASVAEGIIDAIDRGTPVVYLPGKWSIIMMIVRHLPAALFDKLDI